MAVLINFKICDNAEECGGIEACPTGALSWDDKNHVITIDNTKCTSCRLCEKACDVYAISVAKDDEEFQTIQKEINDDPRTIVDLMQDRYGSQPIIPAFQITEDLFQQRVLKAHKLVAVEIFNNDSVECMVKSIPIKQLFQGLDLKYQKLFIETEKLLEEFKINKLPALLFFNEGKLLGKVEGYYNLDQLDDIRSKIKEVI